ncbi:MAG: molecular chaperone DnaJ [Halioglobus sp.]
MPRLILLLAIAAVVYILLRRAQAMPPHKRRGEYIKLALGITVVVVLLATLTGRMHWVGAAFTGLLVALRQFAPLLIRFFPLLASQIGKAGNSGGQKSTVETAILRMQLDHETGKLEGVVLQGAFKDWRLEDLSHDQLRELQRYCQDQDVDSVALLDSYLEQRFPGDSAFEQQHRPSPAAGEMNRAEALSVLGLGEDASEDDIVTAHRKLMQKMHPDRGGSDYLAAKINQAKDFLLAR